MIFLWVILCTVLICYVSIRYSRRGRLLNEIPRQSGVPIFGHLLQFSLCDQREFWSLCREIIRNSYPISSWWVFNEAYVNICHPDDLQILLSSQKAIDKECPYRYLKPWLRNGLLISTGDKWSQRRKMLTPAFHFTILKKNAEVMNKYAEKMIGSLKKNSSETVMSLIPFYKDWTLNITCDCTMKVALNKLNTQEVSRYQRAIHDMGDITAYRFCRPYLTDCVFTYLPKLGSLQKRTLQILHDFTSKLIEMRKEYHQGNGNKFLNAYNESNDYAYADSKEGTKEKMDMIDLLLAAEKKGLIDKAGIQEEVDTFIFAGHDTLAVAMTFTTMLLAENIEAQHRARAEVTAIIDAANGKVGYTEIQEFNYLEMCIKESLRLFPPVSTILRYIKEDLQLKHALVPAGTHITMHTWDTHRDPHFWPEPEKFDPDRFLPENSKNRHPFSYVPFSAGLRNCIGQKLAMQVLKSLTARILYDFYLQPVDSTTDIPMSMNFVLNPVNPVHVKFVKINK